MLGRRLTLRRLILSGPFCLLLLFTMCIIWNNIQLYRNFSWKTKKRKIGDWDEVAVVDVFSESDEYGNPLELLLQDDTSSTFDISVNGTLIKRVRALKPSLDYGKDRDLDVEGVSDYVLWYENFHRDHTQLPILPRQQKCGQAVQNIAFLKTHYTGSDVITNILNRYGDLHGLHVALPSDGLSTFYWPMRFQWKYIDITLLNGSLPNIICNHARYNGDVMDNIMSPGTVYISILRNPVTQLETTFNNLGFGSLLDIVNASDPLQTFLIEPKGYIQGVIKRKRFKDSLNLIKNAMFFDLGLSTTEYHKKNIIKATIYELYEKLSLVLIYEYLDESLVLLKRKLCWDLDDIVYLRFHHLQHNTENRGSFSRDLVEMIKIWNSADWAMYEFFNKTLWEEIKYEGDDFWKELADFRQKSRELEDECLGHQSNELGSGADPNLNLVTSPIQLNPNVSSWNHYICQKLLMTEQEYLEYFRKKEGLSKARSKR